MSWVAIIVDPNDNKVEINWFLLKKIVIGPIRGDQFSSCIYFLNLITIAVLNVIVFFSQIFDPLLSGPPFYFILSFPFHLYPPRVA